MLEEMKQEKAEERICRWLNGIESNSDHKKVHMQAYLVLCVDAMYLCEKKVRKLFRIKEISSLFSRLRLIQSKKERKKSPHTGGSDSLGSRTAAAAVAAAFQSANIHE